MTMNALQQFIASKPFGFLKETEVLELVALDRLCPVLVRCGGCRFTCAAQDVAHLEHCIEAGGDYIRDVSFPVGSLEAAARWQPQQRVTEVQLVPDAQVKAWLKTDGALPPFHEGDCGGTFDGFTVGSDADPGL